MSESIALKPFLDIFLSPYKAHFFAVLYFTGDRYFNSSFILGEIDKTSLTHFSLSSPETWLISSLSLFAWARKSLSANVALNARRRVCKRSFGVPGAMVKGREYSI